MRRKMNGGEKPSKNSKKMNRTETSVLRYACLRLLSNITPIAFTDEIGCDKSQKHYIIEVYTFIFITRTGKKYGVWLTFTSLILDSNKWSQFQ